MSPTTRTLILFEVTNAAIWVSALVLSSRLWGDTPVGEVIGPVVLVAYALVNGLLTRLLLKAPRGRQRTVRSEKPGQSFLALGLAVLALSVMTVGDSHAQALPGLPTPDASEVASSTPDLFGRETPRGLANGLIAALAAQDYLRASRYLDPEALPETAPSDGEPAGPTMARTLQDGLDRAGTLLPFSLLSDAPQGAIDDGLPVEQERLGTIRIEGVDTPLLARRLPLDDGTQVWVISAESLVALSTAVEAGPATPLKTALPDSLTETRFAGAPVADWLLLSALALLALAISRLALWTLDRSLRSIVRDPQTNRFYKVTHAALPPVSLYVAVIAVYTTSQSLQVAIVARQTLSQYAGLVGWFAFAWFLWRLIDTIGELWVARMARSDRRRAMSIITFARRFSKVALVAVAGVAMFDTMGLDITAGIAALGLGGLAFALGAQKTVENLVGSLAVIADQPVRVGDFCRAGDVVGTVEDVGMRSTRIRTNARTVVSIPNGVFAAMQIENYSKRDRFHFNPTLGLTYDLDAAGMKRVLDAVRGVLADDVHVFDDEARARFVGFNDSSLDIEIFAYVSALEFAEFLEHQERLLLALMDAVTAAGGEFAFPTQTLMTRGQPMAALPTGTSGE